ncbi:MAG: DNA primase, partial [Deltaproteobacteria bacterium]|nr:DNA primase [Deltaproteobacteria bacterium]
KLEQPLGVVVQSSSAAGKSSLMDAVLELCPAEEMQKYSAMTGQALFYMAGADLKHKVLAVVEEAGAERASYALKLLQSEGELSIASTGKDEKTGKLVTHEYKVEGPVALMLTTTSVDMDEELLNRCLVLTVDEGRAQTRAIHDAQRRRHTLEGIVGAKKHEGLVQLHRSAQRLLRPLAVVNPYADKLTFRDDKTRLRRDHAKYLGLIDAIALLHQHQRPTKSVLVSGQPVEYIEATLDDVALANKLAHAVLGRSLDELPPQTRALLSRLKGWVEERATAEGKDAGEVRFSRREVRDALVLGDTQLKIHLARLGELELVHAHRQGLRALYELCWRGEGEDGAPVLLGLLDVDRLKYDSVRSGSQATRSGVGRGPVGARSGAGRPPLVEDKHDPEPKRGVLPRARPGPVATEAA